MNAVLLYTATNMATRTIVITAFLLFLLGMLSSVNVVFAHGDEKHDNLPSEVNICHVISSGEQEACYLALCEGGVVEECMEDIVDAAIAGSGPKFAKAVLADLVSVQAFDVDAYALAQRIGRVLGEQLLADRENQFGLCGNDFDYGCAYGFFEAFSSTADGVEPDNFFAETICVTTTDADVAEQEACYHQMGHMFMKRNNHVLAPALAVCDALPPEFQSHCWDGVFMENVNEYIASGGGDGFIDDDASAPCNTIEEQYREKCYKNHGKYLLHRFGDESFPIADKCVGAGVYEEVCRQSVRNARSGIEHHHSAVKALSEEVMVDEKHDVSRSWLQKLLDGIKSFFAGLFGGAEEGGEHHDETEHTHDEMSTKDSAVSFAFPRGGMIPDTIGSDAEVITYRERQFQPNTVSIQPGQVVMWRNEDQVFWPAANLHPTHKQYPGSNIMKCATDERAMIFDACEAMGTGAVYAFRFNEVGEWQYHDHINPQARGVVIVSE